MSTEFYVGYQKTMPPGLSQFLRARVGSVLAVVLVLAALFVFAQRPFANSRFEFGRPREFSGIVSSRPYPTLTLSDPSEGVSRYLLVQPGKHGAATLFDGREGQMVRLRGSLIERDARRMIEVVPGTVEAIGQPRTDEARSTAMGQFTLRGEIVDSKCFLGVMKPGELKPHKACAIRCISGGCPPVLVVRDLNGVAQYFLLAAADGGPLGREVLDYVAEPLEITGAVERRDDLLVLKSDPKTFKRL